MSAAAVHVAVLLASAATTAGLAAVGWRRRGRPAARGFAGLMAATTVWTACYAVALVTPDEGARLFWERAQWFGIAFVPVLLLAFLLAYCGRDALLTRRRLAALSVVPAGAVVAAWTNPAHGLLWRRNDVVVVDGVAVAVQAFGPVYWVNLLYTYLLVGASVVVLVDTVRLSGRPFSRESALLSVGVAVPLVANLVSVLGVAPIEGLDLTPYAFGVTGLAFGRLLFDRRLFRGGVAALRLGRNATLEGLDDGVVVADIDGQVVFRNDAAVDALGRDALPAGTPVADALPIRPAPSDGPETVTVGDRVFEVTAAAVTDAANRPVGTSYLLHDVSGRQRRIEALRDQRERLEDLDAINRLIRGVNRALVGATTPKEVEDAVCHHLADSSFYEGAWMTDAALDGEPASSVVVEPADERFVAVPLPREDAIADGSGDADALRQIAVPIRYGDVDYGSLVLVTDRAGALGDRERAVLEELGETIGLARNGVETRDLLVSDAVVELTYCCRPDASVLAAATDGTAATLALRGLVPVAGDELLAFAGVEDGTPEAVVDALLADDRVADVRALERGSGAGVVEVRIAGDAVLALLARQGASVDRATADDGTAEVVVEVARGAAVRTLTDALGRLGEVALVAKRDRDRPVGDVGGPSVGDAEMTDRQRATLEAAYRAGYFEWPRDSTAEEVAESMDVSPSTLHNHLRKAEGAVVAEFFGE